jgi:hypothetical protein
MSNLFHAKSVNVAQMCIYQITFGNNLDELMTRRSYKKNARLAGPGGHFIAS